MKVLRRRFAEDPEQSDRFYREGQMGASLKHPNIVPITEVCSLGDLHFLVMKFVEGATSASSSRFAKSSSRPRLPG